MATKVARKWAKVARYRLGILVVARLSLECQVIVFPKFPLCWQHLGRKQNTHMDVQNRLRNAKRPSFSMWSHHWLTRNGGLVRAAEEWETPLEALFSDSCGLECRRTNHRSLPRPRMPNREWNQICLPLFFARPHVGRRGGETLHDVVEHGREEDAEQRHPQHAGEHGHAQRTTHFGPGPRGDHQRHHA